MKVLCFLLVLKLVSGEVPLWDSSEEHWSDDIAAETRSRRILIGDENDGNSTCSSIYSCQDCKTARICKPTSDGAFEVLQTIACPAERPFCDPGSGACVNEEPESCGKKDDSFICLGNGKYPDTDCRKFHACLDLQSVSFECSAQGDTYNPYTKTCEASYPCGSFDCATMQGRKVSHSEHAGYFAYCQNSNGPLVIDSCPGDYQLNATSQICEPSCSAEGIVGDVTDCHYYFKCTKVFIRRDLTYMQRDRLRCPEGFAYSHKEFMCIAESNVEECQSRKS